MFFHFINCKNFHLNVFWVSSIIQINKLLFLLSLSPLFWLHDQQIYLQKREVFSEDNLRIIFTFYRKITHLLHFLPIFTHLTSYILHMLLKITSYLLPIWSTFIWLGIKRDIFEFFGGKKSPGRPLGGFRHFQGIMFSGKFYCEYSLKLR